MPPELAESLVVQGYVSDEKQQDDETQQAEQAEALRKRRLERQWEVIRRLTLVLTLVSSMGWSLASGFVLAGGRISLQSGFSAPVACASAHPDDVPELLSDGTAKQPSATDPVPHAAETREWDAASFNAAAIFGDATVPEFVDPELLAQVNAVRADYAHAMHIPSTSRARLADAMPIENGAVAFLVGGQLEKRYGTSTEILFRQESQFLYLSGFDHPEALLVVGLRSQSTMAIAPGQGFLFIDRGDPVWG
eukprot:COSAG02_NODE_5019_length_4721_cov_3.253942_4_plen_249_part_01